MAAAAVPGGSADGRPGTPVAVVGRDPRVSGGFLEAAVVASAGVDVLRLGVIPTPARPTLVSGVAKGLGNTVRMSPSVDTTLRRGRLGPADAIDGRRDRLTSPAQIPGRVSGQ